MRAGRESAEAAPFRADAVILTYCCHYDSIFLMSSVMFPFGSKFVDLPQGKTHYVDDGEGPVLLLLHPAPATAFFYKKLLLELRGRFRLIAPDFPGFGLSQANSSFGAKLEDYSRFVSDLALALRLEDALLFVTDASGPVGVHAAAQANERFRGLVLADTFAFPLRGRFRLVKFVLKFLVPSRPMRRANRRFNLFPWMVSTLAPYKNPWPKEDRQIYQRLFATPEQRDLILDWFEQLGSDQAFLEATEAGIRERLAHKNVLLIYGQFDPMRLIGAARRLRQLFTNATNVVIPWEDHFPVLGSAKQVAAAVLAWRDEVLGGTRHDR